MMEFKKGDILELEIENMGINGEGVAKADGFPVFVKDAVQGDVCSIKLTKVKKDYAYGHLLEVRIPSVYRVKEACPAAKRCGGCSLQAVSYERQLRFKEDRVYDCLKRIGKIDEEVLKEAVEEAFGAENPFRYRNKAQYPIGRDKDGNVTAGFYAARSHTIVPVSDCLLLPEEFSEILELVLDIIREKKISVYDETTKKGLIRHLLLKKAFATGQTMAVLVINGQGFEPEEEVVSCLKRSGKIDTALININTDNTNVILGKNERILFGEGYITDILCGLKFRISAASFYQINPYTAEKIYETVLEYACLSGDEEVWDVCCGIGTISLFLALSARKVVGIEISYQAIEDAKKNAEINNITNSEFICAAAEDILPGMVEKQNGPVDVIIMDPPRSGMERKALDAVIKAFPERIVYVSCDPATMARDVKILSESGYKLRKYRPFDQFCQTYHVETCVLLTKTNEVQAEFRERGRSGERSENGTSDAYS